MPSSFKCSPMTEPRVILLNESKDESGSLEKLEAHQKGLLHKAFSVFIFNHKGELLMQQRADEKYHSGGLWTNTCCGHPEPGESTAEAAKRRLLEEMGITAELAYGFEFTYKSQLDNGLTEHESDDVFYGISDQKPNINPAEARDWKYLDFAIIEADLSVNPHLYTEWFKICFEKVKTQILPKLS